MRNAAVPAESIHWLPAERVRAAVEGRKAFVRHPDSDALHGIGLFLPHGNATGQPPVASVIIPTLDGERGGYFAELLRQLERQTLPHFEVIIVQGDVRQGRAINTAAAIARGKFLITLDDDTSLGHERVLQNLISALEGHPDVGVAGAANLPPPAALPFVRRAMQELGRRSSPPVDAITDSDLAEHPCLAIPKELFYRIGGELETVPRGLDPYLRQQVRKAGYRVVVIPDTFYHHLPPASLRALLRQFFRNGVGSAYISKFHPELVWDTPECHAESVQRHPLPYRAARRLLRLMNAPLRGHWLDLLCNLTYSVGYAYGWLRVRRR